MSPPKPEWISGNVFIRPNVLDEVGAVVAGHVHNFDHTTIVFTGAIHVKASRHFLTLRCSCGREWETLQPRKGCTCGRLEEQCTQIAERRELIAERDFEAPAHCLIKADIEHEITALKPHTEFWCVYSHRDPQARITQEWHGWGPAYG